MSARGRRLRARSQSIAVREPAILNVWFVRATAGVSSREQNRQKIATGAMREKRRQVGQAAMAKNGATMSNVTPKETGRTAWTGYIMSAIDNHTTVSASISTPMLA